MEINIDSKDISNVVKEVLIQRIKDVVQSRNTEINNYIKYNLNSTVNSCIKNNEEIKNMIINKTKESIDNLCLNNDIIEEIKDQLLWIIYDKLKEKFKEIKK